MISLSSVQFPRRKITLGCVTELIQHPSSPEKPIIYKEVDLVQKYFASHYRAYSSVDSAPSKVKLVKSQKSKRGIQNKPKQIGEEASKEQEKEIGADFRKIAYKQKIKQRLRSASSKYVRFSAQNKISLQESSQQQPQKQMVSTVSFGHRFLSASPEKLSLGSISPERFSNGAQQTPSYFFQPVPVDSINSPESHVRSLNTSPQPVSKQLRRNKHTRPLSQVEKKINEYITKKMNLNLAVGGEAGQEEKRYESSRLDRFISQKAKASTAKTNQEKPILDIWKGVGFSRKYKDEGHEFLKKGSMLTKKILTNIVQKNFRAGRRIPNQSDRIANINTQPDIEEYVGKKELRGMIRLLKGPVKGEGDSEVQSASRDYDERLVAKVHEICEVIAHGNPSTVSGWD